MQKIIASFTEKYGLTETEVMTEIESAFAAILSGWYISQHSRTIG
jgi:hypothetical protein